MKIQLDDNYFIEVNQWSYDLRKDEGTTEVVDAKTNTVKSVKNIKDFGYFSSLERAVEMYVRLMLIQKFEPETDLKTYVLEYGTMVADLLSTIKEGMKK